MKRSLLVFGIGVVVVGLLAGFGYGGRFGAFHRGPMDPKKLDNFLTYRINDALDDVKATPEQRTQVLALKDRLMPEAKVMMDAHKATHEKVQAMWKSDATPDQRELRALVDARIEDFRALGYKLADGFIELHKVFTPEQRAELVLKAEQHHAAMQQP